MSERAERAELVSERAERAEMTTKIASLERMVDVLSKSIEPVLLRSFGAFLYERRGDTDKARRATGHKCVLNHLGDCKALRPGKI